MQDREKIRQLFERYRQGKCTPEEQAQLYTWFNQYASQEAHGLDELPKAYETDEVVLRRRRFLWLPYAAAIFIAGLMGAWYFYGEAGADLKTETVNLQSNDIAPGRNRAALTLANGRVVNLSEAQKGIVVGDSIRYLDGSSVIDEQVNKRMSKEGYSALSSDKSGSQDHVPNRSFTLSTPKGGTYQIALPDGTQVWLNAASTLTYPEQFADDERRVKIEGEGYFSVIKDKHRPFKINSRDQEIVVLGTEFNVSAYVDDAEIKTTLVEGAVRLRAESSGENMQLFAGEQGLIKNGSIRKQSVDPTPSVAWKSGDFYFDNTPLVDVMKQVERWYDVDVIFKTQVPRERFSGGMSRDVTLQTVLQLLKVSEIKYYISDSVLYIE